MQEPFMIFLRFLENIPAETILAFENARGDAETRGNLSNFSLRVFEPSENNLYNCATTRYFQSFCFNYGTRGNTEHAEIRKTRKGFIFRMFRSSVYSVVKKNGCKGCFWTSLLRLREKKMNP